MTTIPVTPAGLDVALLVAAATAAADRLPTSSPLGPGDPAPSAALTTGAFHGAVVADVVGPAQARLALLVGEDLVAALADSPVPGLTLAAAAQPAIDAAAATLGASAGEAREVDPASVIAEIGGASTAVPLLGAGPVCAFLASDALVSSATTPTPGFVVDPVGADVVASPVPVPVAVPVRRGLDLLHGVDMELTVELGRTRMAVRDLLSLAPGDVIELDRAAGAPADLLVNGRLIARGEVVVVDENFGLRVTEILDSQAG